MTKKKEPVGQATDERISPDAVEPKKMGRPPIIMTPEQAEQAILLAEEGHTKKHVLETLLIDKNVFKKHCEQYPDFRERFARARYEGLEELADSLQTVADETNDVLRARLKSENLRWILSKRKPQTYGDRIEINVNQTIDIKGALEEAKRRAQQTNESDPMVIHTESRVITDTSISLATDPKSVDDILK